MIVEANIHITHGLVHPALAHIHAAVIHVAVIHILRTEFCQGDDYRNITRNGCIVFLYVTMQRAMA